jgi:hypothetical protein
MTAVKSTNSSWSCFSPTLGIFAGIFLGWAIHFFLPEPANLMIDLAARFLDLIFALIGWAIGTALYGRQIHCGGSQPTNKAIRDRYYPLITFILVLLILAPILLVQGYIFLYFLDAAFLFAVICGEIKLGKPFWFLKGEPIL